MVPHLVTALTGPINELEQRVLDSMPAIERWFRLEWMEHTPAFYCSVALRNAGFKLAPVDTQLYPGGWNHLSAEMLPLAVQAAMAAIEKICPEAKNLLLIPQNRSHDRSYLSNLAQLRRIFHMAGLHVRLGSIDPDIRQDTTIALPNGESVTLEPVQRVSGRLMLKHFDPCTILLNNDLSAGVPGILEDLHEQYLLPPLHAAGSVRRRSRHSQSYEDISKRLGKLLGVDPWLLSPMFGHCTAVDWGSAQGMAKLRAQVDAVLTKVKRKYKEYGIVEKPFVVIKADYGAADGGLLTVRDVKALDILQAPTEHGARAPLPGEVIVQEGVLTCERLHDAVAEPVVYMMDRYVVGGFYRIHTPEASIAPLAFEQSTHLPQLGVKPGASAPNRFYMYGVIARLAMLAASYELEATDPAAENAD